MSLIEEIRKPFNLLNFAIAFVSLALSVYFYFQSQQKREPYYLSYPTTQIYKKTNASPNLHLVDKAGTQIDGDVHVLEFSFWNSGRQSIEPADVRTPIFFTLPEKTKVLDYSIVRENKADISGLKLSLHPDTELKNQRIQISWKHLDPGLGARIQVIYVGDQNQPLTFGGDILDAEITNGASVFDRSGFGRASLFLFGGIGALASELSKRAFRRIPKETPVWRRRITKIIFFVLIIGIAFVINWITSSKIAPV